MLPAGVMWSVILLLGTWLWPSCVPQMGSYAESWASVLGFPGA